MSCAHSDPRLFTDRNRAVEASELCDRCPHASACLGYAIDRDVAYRTGSDLYGVTGTYAGIWFEQRRPPRRVIEPPTCPADAARRAAEGPARLPAGRPPQRAAVA